MGHAAFDSFRNEFREAVACIALAVHDAFAARGLLFKILRTLEVALARALSHGGERTHSSISLEGAALVEDGFAGALIDSRKKRADHHDVRAGRDGLGDVT